MVMTNTSDDLIKRLEEPVDNGRSYIAGIVERTSPDPLRMEAAVRIRELEAELQELALTKIAQFGQRQDMVLVPIEPTQQIRSMAHDAYCDALMNREAVSVTELIDIVYRTSIRAATQESD